MICKRCKKPIERGKEGWLRCELYCTYCYHLERNPPKGKKGKHMERLWKEWIKLSNG